MRPGCGFRDPWPCEGRKPWCGSIEECPVEVRDRELEQDRERVMGEVMG